MSADQDLRAQIAVLKADNESLTDALNMERRRKRPRKNWNIDFGDIAFFAFFAWALYLMDGK